MRLDWFLRALFVGLTALSAVPVGARQRPAPGTPTRITLSLRETPLRASLEQLFAGADASYVVGPEIPDPRLTLSLRDVTREQALRTVVRRYLKNRDGDFRDGIYVELSLKGLASIGTRTLDLFNY